LTGSSASIEIHGGDGNDRIISSGLGSHGLYGDNGDDWFVAGQGDDWIVGGDGFDTVDYSGATGPINAATEVANNNTGNSGFDTINSVEKIIGSNYDDTLWAFQVGHQVWGGAGNDTLKGSGFGASQLYGGAGNDTYEVWHEVNEVIEAAGDGVDLVVARGNFTLGQNVENLTLYQPPINSDPYAGASILPNQAPGNFNGTGNDLANVIIGNGGANILFGQAGTDTLTGGAGADTLIGGVGYDTFLDTAANLSGDKITDLAIGDKIVISNASLAGFTFSQSGNILTYSGGTLTLAGFTGRLQASAAVGGGVQLTVVGSLTNATGGDFNGDGRSDVLLRHDNGLITDWLGTVNGGFTDNWSVLARDLPNDWQILGAGDFNGDNRDDLLLRATNGLITDWLGTANGGFTDNWSVLARDLSNDWQIVGVGDFNGDNRDDLLLRSSAGRITDWLGTANGGFTDNSSAFARDLSNDWQIAGIGDFNGDNRADLLLRATNGLLTDWLGAANGGFTDNWGIFARDLSNDWHVQPDHMLI
jgi:hypothetical protein